MPSQIPYIAPLNAQYLKEELQYHIFFWGEGGVVHKLELHVHSIQK